MAPDVTILPAGGLPDGGIGTDYDEVVAATQRADSGAGVVLLYDLGNAQMTAELAVESLADPSAALVADGPLVEGAIAAAVAAQAGGDRKAVAEAAAAAGMPEDLMPAPPVTGGVVVVVVVTRSSWSCTTRSACTRGRPRCWCAR